MLSVGMLNVVMLSVVAPKTRPGFRPVILSLSMAKLQIGPV
jgi:hypothetical protein